MINENSELLVGMTFLPVLAAVAVVFTGARGNDKYARWIALASAVLGLAVSLTFLRGAAGPLKPGEFSHSFTRDWVPSLGMHFALGMDGLSALLCALTNFLTIISIMASWTAVHHRQREFYAFLLTLQTGVLGTFLALDLFLFYIFWELMLIPLYFLIGIFGSGNRIYATMKFFLYTMAGSMLMLVGILSLWSLGGAMLPGGPSFLLRDLLAVSQKLSPEAQRFIFLSFFLAFAIKIPLFPFHTWLPDAHTEAPTAGSIMLAGVLLKTGVYGLMRFVIPLFPAIAQEMAPMAIALSVIAIIYGALTAFAQEDMKRLVAYSSVSHMGFIALGVFSGSVEATTGAALQMVNHGISTGALFFCVGVLYERRHTRLLSEFGGLAHRMKVYTVLTVIVVLSSVGLPGLNGFVGEFLVLLGTFQRHPYMTIAATSGVILAAVYLLRMTQLTFFGPLENEENKHLSDVNPREFFSLASLIFLAVWLGLFPGKSLNMLTPISETVSRSVLGPAASEAPAGAAAVHAARALDAPADAANAFVAVNAVSPAPPAQPSPAAL